MDSAVERQLEKTEKKIERQQLKAEREQLKLRKKQEKKERKMLVDKVSWLHDRLTQLGLGCSIGQTFRLMEEHGGDQYAALQSMIKKNGCAIAYTKPRRNKCLFGLW